MTTKAATPVAETEIKFREELVEMKDKIKASALANADAATGTITLPADFIFGLAPEGLTVETHERDRKFFDLVNNAATLAGSELAVDLFKTNKELQTVSFNAPIWKKDGYEGVFKRQGTSRNVKTGEVSNYVGSIGVGRINVVSTRTQTEWQSIKANMRALAEAADL
jgi:hypothetical protein